MSIGASNIKYVVLAAVSFLTGNHLVHSYYKPLKELEEMVQQELNLLMEGKNYRKKTLEDKMDEYYQFSIYPDQATQEKEE